MSNIYIKRRRDPIVISEDRAVKLKQAWLTNPKSEDIIDLGEWSGEISQIVSIEIEKKQTSNPIKNFADENYKARKEILATPIEVRAGFLGKFKLAWFMRSGLKEKEPPADIMLKAKVIALEHYTKEPNDISVPMQLFEPLLFSRFGIRQGTVNASEILANKITIPRTENSDIPF